MSTILEQKCPCCGGAVEFNTGAQRLKCPYCDTEFDITAMPEDTSNQVEQINWNSQGAHWGAGETDSMSVYACNSCGGEIVADTTTGATTCPYCGNQVVMKGQFSGALKPDLVIPFKLDKKAAKEALKKHISTKKFVPKSFLTDNRLEEIKGVYVPHWLFTCDAIGNANYKAKKVKTWSDENYEYTETSYFDIYRSGNIGFDNIPVDGSTKMPDDLMESLEPYNITEAVPFNIGYLSGYLADKFDVGPENSMPRANERIRQSLVDTLSTTVNNYDSVNAVQANMSVLQGNYQYALYPVWLLTVKHNNKDYTFAMNGQTGKFVGNIPTDTKKVKSVGALIGAGIGIALWAVLNLIGLI